MEDETIRENMLSGEYAKSVCLFMFMSGFERNAIDGLLMLNFLFKAACIGVEPDRRQHRDRLPLQTWRLAVV